MADSFQKTRNTTLAEESCIIDNTESPESRFECPICLTWLRDPVLTSCGHRFCRNCIQSWLERETACPVDNIKLNKGDIFPDNFTRREISQQKTKCPYISRGCLEELSPLDVEIHIVNCKFKPPQLPENERLRCSFVAIGCDGKFEDEPELQTHLEQETVKHLNLLSQAYLKLTVTNVPSTSTSAIAQQANFWDPPVKNEQSSSDEASRDSVQNLLRALYEKIVILEQKNREQEIIIANMSEQIATYASTISKLPLRYCNGCYIWNIHDFKSKLNAMHNDNFMMYYSPGFYTSSNGYKICIRFNLSPKDQNYIAVLIHMMKSGHDETLDWPFSGRITVTLIHPNAPYKNIKETMMTRPELEAFKRPAQDFNPKGFGYTEFASLEDVLSQGFVETNRIVIKVQAQPV